jgi:hypothetical protein
LATCTTALSWMLVLSPTTIALMSPEGVRGTHACHVCQGYVCVKGV